MERIIVLALVCVSCGGGAESAAEKCDDLISDLCDRGVSCIPAETGSHATCVQQIEQVLACGSAKKVSDSYGRCIDQVKSDSCAILFPQNADGSHDLALPADCNQVILNREAGGDATNAVFAGVSELLNASAD